MEWASSPLRALRSIVLGILSAALWPVYLALLSTLTRAAPWPLSLSRPIAFVLSAIAIALFLANLIQFACKPGGWAEAIFNIPPAVARQLRRALLGLVAAAVLFLLPDQVLKFGMIAPQGRPIPVAWLGRLFLLGFQISVWVVVFRLVRSKSELVIWLLQGGERKGWLARNRRLVAWTLLAAIGTVIGLDIQGYGFTARRLASAGSQSMILALVCIAIDCLVLRAIDEHAWRWVRHGSRTHQPENPECLNHAHDLASRLRQIVRWVIPAAGILVGAWIWNVDWALFQQIGDTPVWSLASGALKVGDLFKAIVIFSLTIAAWVHMSTFFAIAVYPRISDDPGIRFAALTLSRYLVLGLGLLTGLSTVHLGIEQIGMVLAALGVGLGFGLQEIVSNFVSGIILLVERPIRVGDIVTVSGMSGKVDRINIRATTIINSDNQSIIVPNREFITSNLVNWTHKDRIIRVTIGLNVAYGTCPDRVADLLLTIARDDPDVLRNPVPSASLEAFGASALNFQLHVHVPDPSVAGRVRHRISTQIQKRFQESGILIPMPGQEIHVRTVPREWTLSSAGTSHPLRFDPPTPTPPAPAVITMPEPEPTDEAMHRCVDE